MFPIRSSWIFKSRWMALLWAVGILWFALDFSGSGEPPSNNSAASDPAAP